FLLYCIKINKKVGDFMKIGEYIKSLREEKGLSLRETAKWANISHPYLSQIETGKHTKPSADFLFKVSTSLKVNVIALLYYSDYISQEQRASPLNVSLTQRVIREDIRDSL